jgi:type IV secretory pathway VirB3-like protein
MMMMMMMVFWLFFVLLLFLMDDEMFVRVIKIALQRSKRDRSKVRLHDDVLTTFLRHVALVTW